MEPQRSVGAPEDSTERSRTPWGVAQAATASALALRYKLVVAVPHDTIRKAGSADARAVLEREFIAVASFEQRPAVVCLELPALTATRDTGAELVFPRTHVAVIVVTFTDRDAI
jgi:hypothetical protein